jgi:hypothetical protein
MTEEPLYRSRLSPVNLRMEDWQSELTVIQTYLPEYNDSSEETQSYCEDAECSEYRRYGDDRLAL